MNQIEIDHSLKLTWMIANNEAFLSSCKNIEPIHFYYAMLKIIDEAFNTDADVMGIADSIRNEIKKEAGVCRKWLDISEENITRLRRSVRKSFEYSEIKYPKSMLHRSDISRGYFNRAIEFLEDNSNTLTMLHLLKSFISEPSHDISGFMPEVTTEKLSKLKKERKVQKESTTPNLDVLGRNLSKLAKEDRLVPIIGREKEKRMLVRYLMRTSKRNVILIGDAGVGKTAVVEGLALKLASDDAPNFLRKLKIIQVNIADLISGTKYRGDMESRIQELIKEAVADPDLILFFDEIHLLMRSGSSGDSAMDIANILKPALARDDFRCIGATTTEEYERYVKNDSAFMRRFQVVRILEPSEEESVEICSQWARRIEGIQDVIFDDEAITASVQLSKQWIHNRHLPDKAIDLLENAATFVKVSTLSFKGAPVQKEPVRIRKQGIIDVLEEQYGITVSASDVIDINKIKSDLKLKIIGQDKAIDNLSESLNTLANRKDDSSKPMGIFLFTGSTGIGKTYTAECLYESLYGKSDQSFARFNMNEYKERHELSKLVGSPPGFIGHEQLGSLYKYIEKNPQGVILLDEIEKAHTEIQDYFLQIFDKGVARDSKGREAVFKRYIIIMTSNLGSNKKTKHNIGFNIEEKGDKESNSVSIEADLLKYFSREFIARVDRIIEFRDLTKNDYENLLNSRISSLIKEIKHTRDLTFNISNEAKDNILKQCSNQNEGVRGFVKEFERIITEPLNVFFREKLSCNRINIDWVDNHLIFNDMEIT